MCKNMCATEPPTTRDASFIRTPRSIHMTVRTLVDRNASVAEVTYVVSDNDGGSIYAQTGSSKREPGDPFYPALGEQLAVSRALSKLAVELKDAVYESFPWDNEPEPLVTLDAVMAEAGGIPEETYRAWALRFIKSLFRRS